MTDNLILFRQFAKGINEQKTDNRNCVIYTRVSTKEQADNNFSLSTQRKACEQFAKKSGYTVMGYFGGTYESAKTDERKEFNNMLSFVRKCKEKISCIIVYSVDRFSRSGANAIYIAEQLKKQGIVVCSVTQPTDATTASGSLQQNIQFIFSEYDNQLRREKCMAGMKEKIQQGIWCTTPPIGYDIVWSNGKKEIKINQTGKLLKKGFLWKAEGLSNEEVRKKLAERGLKLSSQRVSAFLRNPFYCGLIVHTMLEGKIVDGIQEKITTKEIFLKVNGILSNNHYGYTTKPENEAIPLKRFLRCEDCGNYLRAYKAYKNQQYYYKCNTPGCKCNKRADELHRAFKTILGRYTLAVNADYRTVIKTQTIITYNQLNKDKDDNVIALQQQANEINKKLERLEERFILEEIDKGMFDRYRQKFVEEKLEIEQQIAKSGYKVSNLEKCIEFTIDLASKLAATWEDSDYKKKQKLQFLLFPNGLLYNRKKDECRTPRVNSVFSYIAALASISANNKKGDIAKFSNVPALVAPPRIELGSKV